jgi:hypothetical protein
MTPEQVRELVQQFLTNRNLNPEQGVGTLMAENATLREQKRQLDEQVKGLPPAGALVLTGDEVTFYNEAKGLNVKVEDLKKIIKDEPTLRAENQKLARDNKLRDIADAEGWKVPVLDRLTNGMELFGVEEVEEETDDPENEGQKKKTKVMRGYLNVKDDKGTVTGKKKLAEELQEFLPSLVKDENKDDAGEASAKSGAQGTSFVRQSRGSKAETGGTKDLAKNLLKKRYPGIGKPEDKK